MPHTSHKRHRTPQKRRQIVDDDGWTHVTNGPTQTDFDLRVVLPVMCQQEEYQSTAKKGLTLDKVKTFANQVAQKWEATKTCKDIEKILVETVLHLDSLKVDSCVCLALGSFTSDVFQGRPIISMYQLAALESMLRVLRRKFSIKTVYFQDPFFNNLDMHFLRDQGFTVLKMPAAMEYITPSTFLFAPCVTWATLLAAVEKCHPSLMVTNDLQRHLNDRELRPDIDEGSMGDPDPVNDNGAQFRRLLQTRNSYLLHPTHDDDMYTGMSQQAIYWQPDPVD